MRSGTSVVVGLIAKWRNLLCSLGGGLVLLLGLGMMPGAAYAQSTTSVSVSVCPSPTSLTLESPFNGTLVSEPTVEITGYVHCLSQIRIYIDDIYHKTVPLDANASTFTTHVTFDQAGKHTVKLVGVAIRQDGTPEATVMVVYSPKRAVAPENPSDESGRSGARPSAEGGLPQWAETFAGGMLAIIEQAVHHPAASAMSDAMFRFMQTLGLIAPDMSQPPLQPVVRFVVMTIGAMLVVAAHTVMSAYERVSRLIAGRRSVSASAGAISPRAVKILRFVGVILFIAGLLFPA